MDAPRRDPDRLFWNLAIFMIIPILVLLLAASWLARRDRASATAPALPAAVSSPR